MDEIMLYYVMIGIDAILFVKVFGDVLTDMRKGKRLINAKDNKV